MNFLFPIALIHCVMAASISMPLVLVVSERATIRLARPSIAAAPASLSAACSPERPAAGGGTGRPKLEPALFEEAPDHQTQGPSHLQRVLDRTVSPAEAARLPLAAHNWNSPLCSSLNAADLDDADRADGAATSDARRCRQLPLPTMPTSAWLGVPHDFQACRARTGRTRRKSQPLRRRPTFVTGSSYSFVKPGWSRGASVNACGDCPPTPCKPPRKRPPQTGVADAAILNRSFGPWELRSAARRSIGRSS